MQEEKGIVANATQSREEALTISALIARIRELEEENKKLRHCLVAQWLGVENE